MNIVVVCLGNTCRSPMVAAILKQAHPDWVVRSFGLMIDHEQKEAAKFAIELFPELKSHVPTELIPSDLKSADIVIIVQPRLLMWLCDLHGRLTLPALVFDIADPAGGKLKDYALAVTQIRQFLVKSKLIPKES